MSDLTKFETQGAAHPTTGWRTAGIVTMTFGGLVVGQVVFAVWLFATLASQNRPMPTELTSEVVKSLPTFGYFLVANLSLILVLVGLVVGVRLLSSQPLRTLVTTAPSFRWNRFALGAGATFVSLVVSIAVSAQRSSVTPKNSLREVLPALGLVLLLTPWQVLSEEVLFRGFLLQRIAGAKGRRVLAVVVSSALFAAMHLANPEAAAGGLLFALVSYGSVGLLLSFLTVREQGLELSVGVHTMNNVFSLVLVSSTVTALPMPSLYSVPFDPTPSLADLVWMVLVVVLTQVVWPRVRRNREAGPQFQAAQS